ncbi:hypothetical protein KNP414_02557 [Paenibacillus mucilaginosus KNP414]|uniref:Uncharacterized protein n=1 Tax=Paenibacillus mucilaginosus (strain KNP414) TaxID=1036673 RepID=F8FAM9_PAEMK|nr:hypothetical protein KNP414_02557 [Paenibacillus mucilaginosus KNP414]
MPHPLLPAFGPIHYIKGGSGGPLSFPRWRRRPSVLSFFGEQCYNVRYHRMLSGFWDTFVPPAVPVLDAVYLGGRHKIQLSHPL